MLCRDGIACSVDISPELIVAFCLYLCNIVCFIFYIFMVDVVLYFSGFLFAATSGLCMYEAG